MSAPVRAGGRAPDPGRSLLERALAPLAEVRPGEGRTTVLLTLNVLLLLVAYYLLKTVREPLILAGGGAELKSYSGAAQAVVLAGLVPIYSRLARRLPRLRLLATTTIFFSSNLVLFWALARLDVPYLGVVFFVWLGCFNLAVIAQAWSFAADVFSAEQGQRLFAIVGVGSSTGAVVGSFLAGRLLEPLGAYAMMLVAAALLMVCLALTWIVHASAAPTPAGAATPSGEPPVEPDRCVPTNGFQLLARDRYLLLIAAMVLLLNVVNTTGEYVLDRRILEAAAAELARTTPGGLEALDPVARARGIGAFVGRFRADFFGWVNLVGAGLQLFVVSRAIRLVGVRGSLFVLPALAFAGYAAMAFLPALALVRLAKIAENSVDYSLQNTVRQALWLPTTRLQKYAAKSAVDTFVVRAGDVASALLVLAGTSAGLGVSSFAFMNVALVAAWLLVVAALAREHARKERALPS